MGSDPGVLPALSPLAARILDEVRAGSLHVDDLAVGTDASVAAVLGAIQALVAAELVVVEGSTVSVGSARRTR